jgi:hypothetical protein
MEPSLKILEDIRIASPCHARWDAMTGDDRARHCRSCERTVYNLSALSAEEAAKLFVAHEGRICVRIYRRRDGTIITRDCPVGRSERLRKGIRTAIVRTASWLGFLPLAGCAVDSMGTVDPGRQPSYKSSDLGSNAVMGDVVKPVPSSKESGSRPNAERENGS